MNKLIFFALAIISILPAILLNSCKNEKNSREKSVELMTTQTLGLAYLEEFKFEEAEKEFKKFIKMEPDDKLGYANLGLTYLRMAKYPEAEKQLLKAIKIDQKDANIRLILATVYQMNDQRNKAIEQLKEANSFDPAHAKVLYDLTEIYSSDQTVDGQNQRKGYLLQLVEKAPANLVPKLNLTEVYIREFIADKAVEQLEIIKKQFPDFPKEAVQYFDKAMEMLKKNDAKNALVPFTVFHNYLKVSTPYQAGITDLKGPGGNLIGFPLITFSQQTATQPGDNKSVLEIIKFNDVTASTGLEMVKANTNESNTFSAVADYDNDGDMDILVGAGDEALNSSKLYLFNNDMGRFTDVAAQIGISANGKANSALFADYDNDGFLDLFIAGEKENLLFRNADKGMFQNVSSDTKIKNFSGGKTVFFDFDHDGDLDLYETGSNKALRNNGDGTFTNRAIEMGVAGAGIKSTDASFGDFDDDGDIDFIVANESGPVNLYSNQRQSVYKDETTVSGLSSINQATNVAVGDYNNDGFLDFFLTSATGSDYHLVKNLGNGKYEAEANSASVFSLLKSVKILDSRFFDFDNDGSLDLLVTGIPAIPGDRGLFLFHNNDKGGFEDMSKLLPENPKAGSQISLFDYNDDGDLDILVSGLDGKVSLLRNDGGNMNHYVKIKLVGLKAGSAKNNHFGIGAKVEMRSGDLYQTLVVTDQNVHFGLGNRERADIIRITWTNGVPQNIFMPGADQALIESQTLKGSCPFIYTWNGKEYIFAKDIIWRSALGMPLGIMGGETKYAFADASDDFIKIPGEILQPKDGKYSIQLTSELWETIYIDKIKLLAVDHPDSIDIYVPEQFTPPPFPGDRIYQVNKKHFPVSATDTQGNDLLPIILEEDDNYIAGFIPDRYQGTTAMHELILDPGEVGKSAKLYLFLNGWIFPSDASINAAISQSDALKVMAPQIQVINKKGEWETVIPFWGFPMGKDKTSIIDLSGKFLSNDHRVRIQTNMELYWDQIFFSDCTSQAPVYSTILDPETADFHYRGFSQGYRKGGRYGPHWFDYAKVEKEPKWRDLTGYYTRYGDVQPLLLESDNKYIISNAGDETTITFDALKLPALKPGWKRDFLIHNVGWVKDGDLNTALGQTVLPLPFHGMKSYPPSAADVYPSDPELTRYNKEYNTRLISGDEYRNQLKKSN